MKFPCAHAWVVMQAAKIDMKSKIDDRWTNWATGSGILSIHTSCSDSKISLKVVFASTTIQTKMECLRKALIIPIFTAQAVRDSGGGAQHNDLLDFARWIFARRWPCEGVDGGRRQRARCVCDYHDFMHWAGCQDAFIAGIKVPSLLAWKSSECRRCGGTNVFSSPINNTRSNTTYYYLSTIIVLITLGKTICGPPSRQATRDWKIKSSSLRPWGCVGSLLKNHRRS